MELFERVRAKTLADVNLSFTVEVSYIEVCTTPLRVQADNLLMSRDLTSSCWDSFLSDLQRKSARPAQPQEQWEPQGS